MALRFLVPSLIGFCAFMLPVPTENGTIAIPIAIVIDILRDQWRDYLPLTAVIITLLSAGLTLLFTLVPRLSARSEFLAGLFRVGPIWLAIRVLGAAITLLAYLKVGPELIWSDATGGVLLADLAPVIIVLFLVSCFFIPLLTEYGLMEFVGTLAGPLFRRLFRIPGRGAIDAAASWMGSATVGTLITVQQYRARAYTGREAATIVSCFSFASVGFSFALAATADVAHMFGPVYLTVVASGIVCALILSRIPPLSLVPDVYYGDQGPKDGVQTMDSSLSAAWRAALQQAEKGPGLKGLFVAGLKAVASIYMGLLPSVFAIGGIALMITEATPIFDWLAAPIAPALSLLGLPDAAAAAPAFLVGFADQFLTVIIGAGVASEQTRFVIAVAAVGQIIYMSEIGALILQSPLPLKIHHLFAVFLLRTAIIIPFAAAVSHLFY
ncbi:MAG: YjiH family protein [Pseudomonadota bacterium]